MNDFTKDELKKLIKWHNNSDVREYENESKFLLKKIQSMIIDYQDEKEIHSCYTAIAVDDNFFCKQQHMNADDFAPAIHSLVTQCDGMIKSAGVYAFKLRLIKME